MKASQHILIFKQTKTQNSKYNYDFLILSASCNIHSTTQDKIQADTQKR